MMIVLTAMAAPVAIAAGLQILDHRRHRSRPPTPPTLVADRRPGDELPSARREPVPPPHELMQRVLDGLRDLP
jgi:hypothetical protein